MVTQSLATSVILERSSITTGLLKHPVERIDVVAFRWDVG
jgi:hypothetical protein